MSIVSQNSSIRKYPLEFDVLLNPDQEKSIRDYFPYDTEDSHPYGYYYNSQTNIATFSVHMIAYVSYVFNRCGILYDFKGICDLYSFTPEFDVSKPDFLRPNQYQVAKKLATKVGGLVVCNTGWGKNTLITYLLKHYKGEGNILILGPTLSVLDEIKSRAEKYGIIIGNKIKCLHPAGFMNSKHKDDPDCIQWLNDVSLILVDEIENVPSTMESMLRNYCKNYKYIYGFSATPCRSQHVELSWGKFDMTKMHQDTINVLYYFGQCIAFNEASKGITVNKVYGNIPPEYSNPYKTDFTNFANAVDNAIMSKDVVKYIQYIRELYPDKVLFIPVKTNKQGMHLFRLLSNNTKEPDKNYPTVFWSGSGFKVSDDLSEKDEKGKEFISNYDNLKTRVDEKKVKILISTSVGYRGCDFQSVTDILLIIGTSNAIVNQIVGRGMRTQEELRVWMFYNKADKDIDWRTDSSSMSTPIYNAANGARIKQLRSAHNLVINELGDLADLL